ncbi:hypothetical protein [Flagellimonas meridianipacifica]|uniref:Lipocalin-like protein n=1 Tax=Flagellimonas meridianipacifica TaxID=1080225 RepID=A0A2T0MGR0_9FLAO|nr:hypothetical protein [Allomuricauda pacifica]PRX56752.1 hypothetical protein CLV81_0749 [Allomuricauda pacifica]
MSNSLFSKAITALFYIFLLVTVTSCSKNDDQGLFSPPQWLIGTWDRIEDIEAGPLFPVRLVITSDNIISTNEDGSFDDFSALARSMERPNYSERTIDENNYTASVSLLPNRPGSGVSLQFRRLSDNEMTTSLLRFRKR